MIVHEFGVDRDRTPRRHRLAGDGHLGARRYRRDQPRPAAGGDAPGGAALPRGARRLRDFLGTGRIGSASASALPKDARRGNGSNICTSRPAGLARARRRGARFRGVLAGRRADVAGPHGTEGSSARFATIPNREIADAERQDRDRLGDDRVVQLCRLPRPSGLAAAAEETAATPLLPDRQPAGDAIAQPVGFRRHQPCVEGQGREPIRIHPHDAASRGIRDGDVVRVFNDLGAASPARC